MRGEVSRAEGRGRRKDRLSVGGWRSASLSLVVIGRGEIISDLGLRIANLKARSQEFRSQEEKA